MTHKGTQIISTERLTLRRFTVDDAGAMYRNWASDPMVTQYLFWEPHESLEVTQSFLTVWVAQYAQDGCYNWAIELGGEVVGSISVVGVSERDEYAEIGYCIGRAYWNMGLMTEALSGVLRYFFEEVGLHRVFLKHDEQNPASGRVMLKNGMTYEGTLRRQHRRKDGTWADLPLYGILREEWEKRPRPFRNMVKPSRGIFRKPESNG